jgi:hypothetical protein
MAVSTLNTHDCAHESHSTAHRPAQHWPAMTVKQQAKAGLCMPGPHWLQSQALNSRQGLQDTLNTGEEVGKAGQGITWEHRVGDGAPAHMFHSLIMLYDATHFCNSCSTLER